MAGFTNIAALVVPTVFTGYAIERTKELTAFIGSGILQEDGVLSNWMTSAIASGGGSLTLNVPTWNDLDATDATGIERIGSDAVSPVYANTGAGPTPQGINTHREVAVRVERNMHWAHSVLANSIAGSKNPDALAVIGQLVGHYWARRLQKMTLAILTGVLADNDAAPTGTEHTAGDLTFDVSGGAFIDGVTNVSAEALLDTKQTMGDAQGQLTTMCVHSAVLNRMKKNNLIDYVRDSVGFTIETFQGLRVVVDDGMPVTGQVYDSYLFGPGFLRYANVPPKYAVTHEFRNDAGNGAGSEEMWNRVGWCIHPMGHQYTVTDFTTNAGPSNAATAGNLAHVDSWKRSAQSRKHIPFARLRTREA